MSHRRHHRQVLWSRTMGDGLVLAGGIFVRTGMAPTALPQHPPCRGDRLETVLQGRLPSVAQQGSLHVQDVYRYAAVHG